MILLYLYVYIDIYIYIYIVHVRVYTYALKYIENYWDNWKIDYKRHYIWHMRHCTSQQEMCNALLEPYLFVNSCSSWCACLLRARHRWQDKSVSHSNQKAGTDCMPSVIVFCTVRSVIVCANLQRMHVAPTCANIKSNGKGLSALFWCITACSPIAPEALIHDYRSPTLLRP